MVVLLSDAQAYGDIVSRVVADVDTFADGLLMGFTQLFTGVLMPPRMATKAPNIPTPAYTRLLTKRVAGLVMEEKKIACREQPWSLWLISPNARPR